MELKSPKLQWLNSKTPFSKEYEDRYYSEDNPVEECKYVYLNSNGLPKRWITSTEKRFIIAEIGFGLGLNFILSANSHTDHEINKQLHYIAFEKSPPTKKQVDKFFKSFPELQKYSRVLRNKLPKQISGCHRIQFSEDITLDLHYGDVQQEISNFYASDFKVSAWFVDGFSPKTNPSIWNDLVCRKISEFSDNGTTLSSYSAAGSFRRNLKTNGFEVIKASGFGRKRHMTVAKFSTSNHPPLARDKLKTTSDSVAIIGAGIAGCAVAHSLAKRNIPVQIFESKERELHDESRLSLLALRPRLFKKISPESEFFLHSFLYAASQLDLYSIDRDIGWNKTGLIQLEGALNKRIPINQEAYYSSYPDSILRTLTNEQATELSNCDLTGGGLYFPDGGFIDTSTLCNFYLDTNHVTENYNAPVQSITHNNGTWTLYSETQTPIAHAKTVIIANSHCLTQFDQTGFLPISISHGYSNWFQKNRKQDKLDLVICGEKTIFPSRPSEKNCHLVSATYEKSLLESSRYLAKRENLIGANKVFTSQDFLVDLSRGGEAGMRCGTPDRAPYIGRVPDLDYFQRELAHLRRNAKAEFSIPDDCFWPNLYITAGHGSNGLSTSSFGAEIIASFVNREPIPASKRHLKSICPSRIIIKNLKKQRI